jgi:hypothetical protein
MSPLAPSRLSADYLNDLYSFDPAFIAWNLLSAATVGTRPSAREGHGFTSSGGKLYLHGGYGYDDRTGSYGKKVFSLGRDMLTVMPAAKKGCLNWH